MGGRVFMRLEYEIIRDDYFQASRAQATAARAQPSWFHRSAPYLSFAAGFVLLVKHDDVAGWLAPAALMTAGLVWGLQPVWLAHAAAERGWDDSKIARRPIRLEATEDGLRMRTDLWQSELGWKAFDHFQETRDLFLLYQTPTRLHLIVPKRSFPAGTQMDEFRALLGKNVSQANVVGAGGRGFEVIATRRQPPTAT